jgi:pilus assembly protein Flp/PilA
VYSLLRRILCADDSGQGLAEYALILALVSVAALAALAVLGPGISNLFSNVNTDLT